MDKIKVIVVLVFTLLIGFGFGFNVATKFGEVDVLSEVVGKPVIIDKDLVFQDSLGNQIEIKKGTVVNFDKKYDFQNFYSLRFVSEGKVESDEYASKGPIYYMASESTQRNK